MTSRRKAIGLAFGGLAAVIAGHAAHAYGPTCPVCNGNAYFTGETRTDVSGRQLWKYQCMMYPQHVFWVPQ